MPSRSPRDRRAFIACTALAIAIIVAVWVWTVQLTVANGMAGAREALSTVADTASEVREETRPDPEAVSAIRAGFQGMIDARDAEKEEASAAVDAVAQIIAEDLNGTGEPEGTGGSDDLDD